MLRITSIILACLFFAAPAQARHRHHTPHAVSYEAHPGCGVWFPCEGVTTSARGLRVQKAMGGFGSPIKTYTPHAAVQVKRHVRVAHHMRRSRIASNHGIVSPINRSARQISVTIVAHPEGCPRSAFCGCGASVRVFGHSVRELWLAANWFKFPRAAPAPGNVAVRRHHVFVLEANLGGGIWRVYDANSGGHATRIHARSLAGYTIVSPRA